MGNENRRSDFDQESWQIVGKIGVKTVLKNRMTFSLLDLYECDESADLPSSRRAEEIFEWRKQRTTQEHLPLLYHFEVQRPIIASSQRHRAFTEHMTRVSELPPFSKQEAFLLLEHIIEVLPALYKQFGLFHANVCTVGVNDAGRTKVWVNENFARNYAEEEDVIKNPSQNLELAIVNNLVRMLKSKVYNNQIKPEYPFSLNFLEALRYIRQTRQRFPEYQLAKVYLNRGEFNEAYKMALGQKAEGNVAIKQEPLLLQPGENNRNKGTTPRKMAIETVKTEGSDTALQYYTPYNFVPNLTFGKPNSQQVVYYPLNAVPLAHGPMYSTPSQQMNLRNGQIQIIPQNHNKTMQVRDPKERQLEQSYYLTSPSTGNVPFLQHPKRLLSPTKQERNSPSPSKFMKKATLDNPRSSSPKKQMPKFPENHHPQLQNRAISLSPSKKRQNRPPTSQSSEKQQPNWTRPASVNKNLVRRELSRIVQQQQTKNESFYLRGGEKREEGFNVQLVESIYVKTNETEEGV